MPLRNGLSPFPRRRKSCLGIINASFCACIQSAVLIPSCIQPGKKWYLPEVALQWKNVHLYSMACKESKT